MVVVGRGYGAGYWSPATATIDWCERNYEVTQYVAEYWNTISNAILCVGALCGLYQVRKHKLETRIATCYLSLLLIGVGSTLFHATLKYEMQLLDELPMIWGIASYIYVLWQVDKPPDSSSLLPLTVLLSYCSAVTAFYLWSNQPVFHEVMFGVICVVLTLLDLKQARKHPKALRRFVVVGLSTFLLGCLAWILDNRLCPELTALRSSPPSSSSGVPSLLRPLTQTHALWHVFSGYAGYLQVLLVTYVRQRHLEESGAALVSQPAEITFTTVVIHKQGEEEEEGRHKSNGKGGGRLANGSGAKTKKKKT